MRLYVSSGKGWLLKLCSLPGGWLALDVLKAKFTKSWLAWPVVAELGIQSLHIKRLLSRVMLQVK
jgi:hypothetical protein